MSMLIGVGRALLPGIRRVSYLLHDRFHTPRAAGSVNGTAAEPGPGTRTVIDVENKLEIAGGRCVLTQPATPAYGDLGLRYGAIAREAGRMLLWKHNIVADFDGAFGWNDNADFPDWNAFDNAVKNGTSLEATRGPFRTRGLETLTTATDYQFALVLRSTGCYYFILGGAFTYWTLFWIDTTRSTATLYPTLSANTADFSIDDARVPDAIWHPIPLAYDTFTRANGAIGSSEASGPDSQTTPARTWTNRVGTTQIATNAASASALVGGIAIATVDTGSIDTIVTAEATRAAGNVGIVLRYVDTANYIYAIHDGTNAKLVKRVADVEADVISAVIVYTAGAEIRVIPQGTEFKLYYNHTKAGATSSIADAGLQTGTEQGLYSSNTGNSQDDFSVFPRGTGNEYSGLKRF